MSNNITQYLEELVRFYPISKQQPNVEKLLKYVQTHLEEHGMQCSSFTYNGVHSLYAHPRGSKNSRLLLQGHIDVVPGENQPYQEDEDTIKGRGVYDMLFATASYMQLLDDLGDKVATSDLAILLTGDEELGGFNGVKYVLEQGITTNCCILPDAGEGIGSLSIGAKGVYCIDIEVAGKAHHASRPWEGDNAAFKLVQCVQKLYDQFSNTPEGKSVITLSRLQAGEASNKGPSSAKATLDIRYADTVELERIKQAVADVLDEHNGTILDTEFASNYELDLDQPDVKKFREVYTAYTKNNINLTRAHGSSDARFFSERGMPVIMFRPNGGEAHGDNEWVSSTSMQDFYNILKQFTTELIQ